MALLDAELDRIRYECGYNLLNVGAEPYIGVAAIFSQVIAPYMRAGASTTSATSVSASTSSLGSLASLTLASATGFSAGARIWVDVDDYQEEATVRSVSGLVVTCYLKLAHAGTYPVTVDGGEGVVRLLLKRLRVVQSAMTEAYASAGIKRVDEVEFFGAVAGANGSTRLDQLKRAQMALRDELCSALGIQNLWRAHGSGGAVGVTVY